MVKPGYTTSEFWVTLLTAIVAVLTALGIHVADANNLVQAAAVLASAVAAGAYALGRSHVKANAATPAPAATPPLPAV